MLFVWSACMSIMMYSLQFLSVWHWILSRLHSTTLPSSFSFIFAKLWIKKYWLLTDIAHSFSIHYCILWRSAVLSYWPFSSYGVPFISTLRTPWDLFIRFFKYFTAYSPGKEAFLKTKLLLFGANILSFNHILQDFLDCCTLNLMIKINKLFSIDQLKHMATLFTLLSILPSMIAIFKKYWIPSKNIIID